MLSHNRAGHRGGGGVEIYQEALTGLAPDCEILFLFPLLHDGRWSLRLEGRGVNETVECGEIGLPKLTDPHVEGVFERILFEHRVDLVHIHHLLHLPLSLPLVAKACGVPVVYHLHDHYLVCERWLLLDHAGRFCDVVRRGREQCDACLIAASNYPPGAKARRDGFVSLVVRAINAFVASTPATGEYLRAFYPEIDAARIVTIPMLAPFEPATVARRLPSAGEDGLRLTVAVPGNFARHKGGSDIIELMRICEDYPIHFRVFGRVDEHHAGRLRGLPPDRVTLSGPYEPHAIHALLAGCDVSLHLSTWPETYVIALTEAWQAGLVPVATALGALAERVTDGIDGFLVPPHDPGAVRARLLDLLHDPARLARMRAVVQAKGFPTVAAHLDAVRGVYERLVAAHPCPHDRVPDRVRVTFDLSLTEMGFRVNAPSWVPRDILWDGAAIAPGTGASARPAASLLDALPEPDGGASAVVLPLTHAALAFARDGLRLDDREIAHPSGHDLVLRHLSVKGWLRRLDAPPPTRTYLRFTGPSRTAYAVLHPDDRPDVAASLGDPDAARAGFTGTVDLAGLAFGPHTLDLVQVGREGSLVALGLGRVFAAGVTDGALTRFTRGAGPAAPGPALRDIRQNLPEAGGVLLAVPGDLWAIAGKRDGAEAAEAGPGLRLRGPDGTAWHARIAPGAADDGTVRLVAALTGLEPGRYEIAFHADGSQRSDVPVSLEIVAGPGRYRLDRTMPAGFRRRFIKRLNRAPAIERAARSPASGVVECRGWAFARGLGAVLCTFALWDDATGRPQACIAASLARPDIVAHLGTPQALGGGFELGIPRAALLAGGVRFFQCYRRRTVEFTGFAAALQRALA
jgi:glycosyltransferase involved in cell wall biosynthesis